MQADSSRTNITESVCRGKQINLHTPRPPLVFIHFYLQTTPYSTYRRSSRQIRFLFILRQAHQQHSVLPSWRRPSPNRVSLVSTTHKTKSGASLRSCQSKSLRYCLSLSVGGLKVERVPKGGLNLVLARYILDARPGSTSIHSSCINRRLD